MILAATPYPPSRFLLLSRPFSTTGIAPVSPAALRRDSLTFGRFEYKSKRPIYWCYCTKKSKNADDLFEEFSVLPSEVPWDVEDVWTTFAAYFFILHVPLSYGGLSVVARVLHEQNLDPLTMVVSANALQIAEFVGYLTLLYYTTKPEHKFSSFFRRKWFREERSWIGASIVGLVFLAVLVLLTSLVADSVVGPKDANNPILKEILSYSSFSMAACFVLYCLVGPLLEESVYRGFLLTSLASTMKWWQAVIISSFIFSISHFSGENWLQLYLIGCVLGCAYCWTGSLSSCFIIHSLYNAATLIVTTMS